MKETKTERLLKGKDAALNDEDMHILISAKYGYDDSDEFTVGERLGFEDGYRLGLIAGTEQLLRRIGHYKVVDEGDTTLTEFVRKHPTLVEDLRIAADKLAKARPIVAGALEDYADELAKYEGGQDNG